MIECTTCGAVGEESFSTNYFGELVCELCGTQSFLQARNETQDMEDTNVDVARVLRNSSMKRVTRRSKRAAKNAAGAAPQTKYTTQRSTGRRVKCRSDSAALLDCLRASQAVLRHQAQALAALGGFPDAFTDAVEQIWFQFLETWERKSSRPLLRCFTEYFVTRSKADKAMDPALTQQLLEQWGVDRTAEADEAAGRGSDGDGDSSDAADDGNADDLDEGQEEEEEEDGQKEEEDGSRRRRVKRAPTPRPKKRMHLVDHSASLDHFSIVDLLGILVLAARVLNLGVLPCDVAYWVSTGELPFHNLLAVCCSPELQAAVYDVSLFFESTIAANRVTAVRVAYHAHYLQHHLELPLPPLNVSLAAHTMCANLGFPPQVFRHFQWLAGLFNAKGGLPELPLLGRRRRQGSGRAYAESEEEEQLIASGVGVAAHLAVAVKMTANWHEWVYERPLRRARHVPPYRTEDARLLLRRELDAFVDFCEDSLVGPDRANIPPGFESHVYDLRGKYSERRQQQQQEEEEERPPSGDAGSATRHPLLAYPALYVNGVCAEQDDEIDARVASIKRSMAEETKESSGDDDDDDADVFFYPLYLASAKFPVFHAAYEHVLALLAEYIDAPIASVLSVTKRLDRAMLAACKKLEATGVVVRCDDNEKARSEA